MMKGKSLIGVILAAICVTVTYLLPGSEELSHEGITALGVLGMASILWISNTLPFGVMLKLTQMQTRLQLFCAPTVSGWATMLST